MHDDILSFADGMQEVVLRRPGSDLETTISGALIRRFRSRRHFRVQENVVPIKSVHWYLPRKKTEIEPQEGDEIEDADHNRWTVLEVNRSDLNDLWQCVARMYEVRFGLDEHIDHLRTAFTKTSAGTLQHGFHVVKSGVAAKFTEVTQDLRNKNTLSCYALIRETLETEAGDAIRRADGAIYEIRKIKSPIYPSGWTEADLIFVKNS